MGKIVIKQGDITVEEADVIVNAANESLLGGGGIDGAIHRAAGPKLLEECRKIGGCRTGEAVITNAYNLKKIKKIIHTVGPVWRGGRFGEAGLLKNAYINSLLLSKKEGLRKIIFPAISTGAYGYPLREAAQIALSTGKAFINDFDEIVYICFSLGDLEVYKEEWEKIQGDN